MKKSFLFIIASICLIIIMIFGFVGAANKALVIKNASTGTNVSWIDNNGFAYFGGGMNITNHTYLVQARFEDVMNIVYGGGSYTLTNISDGVLSATGWQGTHFSSDNNQGVSETFRMSASTDFAVFEDGLLVDVNP